MNGRRGILIFGNYPPPYGGVPTHIMYLAEHLADRGWSVHIVPDNFQGKGHIQVRDSIRIHRPSRVERVQALLDRRLRVACYPRRKSEHRRLRDYLGTSAKLRYLKGVMERNDVRVISAYHVFGAATLGAVLSREFSVPMITTIFGEIYSHTQMFRDRIEEVRKVAAQTTRWLSCSRHCARSMELLGLPIPVEAVHYGIDTRHFHPRHDRMEVRRRLGIGAEERVVIFVGRMKEDMGLGVLLQAIPVALARRSDLRFLIVGTVSGLTKAALRMSDRHPGRIHVVTNVPYEELPHYYAAADLATAPSINARACLGLAIVEALATERPVVACDVGGTREVLGDGEMGAIVPPHDPLLLCDAILSLVADRGRLAELGRRGREHAVRCFDKSLANARMEEIFTEAAGASAPSPAAYPRAVAAGGGAAASP